MNVENFELKMNQPIIRENSFGVKFGYYRETYQDKSGIRIRFTDYPSKKGMSGGVYSGTIDEIRPATDAEIKDYS